MADKFYYCIEGTPLRVEFNPAGGGLMICVDRGIPCEGHTQAFSAHCTNTPEPEDVVAELTEYGEHYKQQWNAFVELMQSMTGSNGLSTAICWPTKEAISAVFCTYFVKQIAQAAEKRQEKRWERDEAAQPY